MTGALCEMWWGRCGNPAHLIVETRVPVGRDWEPLTWLVCDKLTCLVASQYHAERYGLHHVETRRLTREELAAHEKRQEVLA